MRVAVAGVVILLLLAVFYVLSYAPAYRLQLWDIDGLNSFQSVPDQLFIEQKSAGVYAPVVWMIDKTPLREPLLTWAAAWGVRRHLESDAAVRDTLRSINSTPF